MGDCVLGSCFSGNALIGFAIEGGFKGVARTLGPDLLGRSSSVKRDLLTVDFFCDRRYGKSRFCGKRFEGCISHVYIIHCKG